ncbi:MAG TPA: PilZ domain-containing protein [Polyangiaceae bacterium]|nr:PilZ domain-containing protein [Polyangiaceae bacterium]
MERRGSRRFPLALRVEVVRAGGSSMSLTLDSRDISATGVFLMGTIPSEIGSRMEYIITLPNGHRLRCLGRLVRNDEEYKGFAMTLERHEFIN